MKKLQSKLQGKIMKLHNYFDFSALLSDHQDRLYHGTTHVTTTFLDPGNSPKQGCPHISK